jgi:hypothetical protein
VFKLRDWPFGPDELAAIRWIKSPFNEDKNGWVLPVVFESEGGGIAQINTSWGSLVLMRFGQRYKGGIPFEACKDGSIVTLDVRNASEGCFCKASAVRAFMPMAMPGLASENCWLFVNDDMVVFIPCIEIVRCFLAPNIMMANALLTPYGLNDIVSFSNTDGQVYLRFDSTVPRKMIDDSFVKYLAWLKTDELAYEAWCGVYRGLMPKGAVSEARMIPLFDESGEPFPGDKRVEVKFPVQGPCRLQVRVLQNANSLFVLEIIGMYGLSLPFERIAYTHSSFKEKRDVLSDLPARQKRICIKRKKHKKDIELVNENPNSRKRSSRIDITPTIIGFDGRVTMAKEYRLEPRFRGRKSNNRQNRIEAENRNYRDKLGQDGFGFDLKGSKENERPDNFSFSTGEVFFDGNPNTRSVDIRSLKTINTPYGSGLDMFFKMLNVLGHLDYRLKIGEPKTMLLPSGKGFAIKKEDDTPRQCVLVPFQFVVPQHNSVYILEVEHSIKTHLSTLLLWPREGKCLQEDAQWSLIEKLLSSLLLNNGHWEKNDIRNNNMAKIITVKHWATWTPYDWAEVILNKIGYISYRVNN